MSQPHAEKVLPKNLKIECLCIYFIYSVRVRNVYDSIKTPLDQDIFRHILFTANQFPSKKPSNYS